MNRLQRTAWPIVTLSLLGQPGCASRTPGRGEANGGRMAPAALGQTPEQTTATPPAAPPAPPAATAAEALELGIAFLVTHQNPDGSWGSFVSARPSEIYLDNLSSHRAFHDATAALCVLALHQPSVTRPEAGRALERGIAYLLAAQPTGRATGGTFYDTWAHTYIVQALSIIYRDERFAHLRPRLAEVIEREIALLAERQALEGGWGYYDFDHTLTSPSGNESTSFNTAAGLIALDEAKRSGFRIPEGIVASALKCLERLRLPSGAYIYGTYAQYNPSAVYNKVKGSLGRSQSCNLALWMYDRDITQDDLLRGVRHLRDEHHFIEIGKGRPMPHEAWYATAGYYFMFGHYYAGRVINELEDLAERQAYRQWLAETMRRLQDPDGSWFDFPLYGYHKYYGAAFGVLTLQECLRGEGLVAAIAAD